MRYKIVKLTNFSGTEASVYTIKDLNTNETLFNQFIKNNISSSSSEIKDILIRLQTIGNETGAREHFFKIKEGIPSDGVCALYDIPGSKLRLYCIRYGMNLIILGGGGVKSKQISALQEDELLTDANYFLKQLSKDIKSRTDSKEICFTNEGMDLEGNLNFYDDEN
ncbi:MAG: hypothetical protein PHW82_12575 [Bacteroidales bacterium]|nr:hypothetical protein [Bacteroidales bacterium]